jgi:hypothetical protein
MGMPERDGKVKTAVLGSKRDKKQMQGSSKIALCRELGL